MVANPTRQRPHRLCSRRKSNSIQFFVTRLDDFDAKGMTERMKNGIFVIFVARYFYHFIYCYIDIGARSWNINASVRAPQSCNRGQKLSRPSIFIDALKTRNEHNVSPHNTQLKLRKLRLSLLGLESAAGIKLRYRARAFIFSPTFARYRRIFAWPTLPYRRAVGGGLCVCVSSNSCPPSPPPPSPPPRCRLRLVIESVQDLVQNATAYYAACTRHARRFIARRDYYRAAALGRLLECPLRLRSRLAESKIWIFHLFERYFHIVEQGANFSETQHDCYISIILICKICFLRRDVACESSCKSSGKNIFHTFAVAERWECKNRTASLRLTFS